ncbi:MAG: hypothetical protein AAFY08_08310 [Planctomycetota bacterium]
MAQLWLTVDDAADALGVSPSTVRRRIKAEKLESRSNPDGVTEVLIQSNGDDAIDALNPSRELSARRRAENTEDQLRANPWIRAARPGEALTADRRDDAQQRQDRSSETPQPDQPQDATPPPFSEKVAASESTTADTASLDHESPDHQQLKEAGHAFTPSDLEATTDSHEELARFQKIAGASVLLAQQQADDAREQVALARHEAFRLRRLCYASWTVSAAVAILCFGLTLYLGYTASSAAARADAAEQALTGHQAGQTARAIADQAALDRLNAASSAPNDRPGTPDQADDRFDTSTTADVRQSPFE